MVYRSTRKMVERKDARRNTILAAATGLFGRQGYHATTVPMIVSEAGTSTGNFYFYFRNKEDVFATALSSLGQRIATAIDTAIAEAPPDTSSQMKAAIRGLVHFLAENPEEARLLIVESSGLGTRLEQIRRSILASHRQGIENALRGLTPNLPPLDIDIAARCWTGAVYEAVYGWLELPNERRPPTSAVAEAIACFNLRGIGLTS